MKRDLVSLNARFGPLYRFWLLGVLMLGSMVMVLSSTSINVALPAIMDEFMMGRPMAQWLATGFLAAMTSGLLLAAWAQAKLGSRLTVQISIGLFVVCSILALMATAGWQLIVLRTLQGCSGYYSAAGHSAYLSRVCRWWPRCGAGHIRSWFNDCTEYWPDSGRLLS